MITIIKLTRACLIKRHLNVENLPFPADFNALLSNDIRQNLLAVYISHLSSDSTPSRAWR
jgi:hypothetical protein